MNNKDLSSKFPCPTCGKPITITLEVLLQGHIAGCLQCGSTLKVNRTESSAALEKLEKVLVKINNIPGATAATTS